MAEKNKEKFEILLEEMRSNFKLAFEGISGLEKNLRVLGGQMEALDKKYGLTTRILSSEIKDLGKEVKGLGQKVDKIDQTMEEHMRVPHAV